ncbi:hypothetical protein SAMN05444678_106232 [Sphingomonas sp. YR710]|uniref:hypothetical protein n=1 Tax=Sphingomonas sp. YR710 TaxID=1882773 RepID=UPI000886C7EF|nr:hypothetical protein [Sphingomonas sp. YR710]SDC89141.1 hypothetical protein SAMN05444678_106232 [Sphingomonas sp. YR710]
MTDQKTRLAIRHVARSTEGFHPAGLDLAGADTLNLELRFWPGKGFSAAGNIVEGSQIAERRQTQPNLVATIQSTEAGGGR